MAEPRMEGAVTSPIQPRGFFRSRKAADAELPITVPVAPEKSAHRQSLDGLRKSISAHVAELRAKAKELQTHGIEAKATSAALATLASAFADVGEKLVQAGKEFYGIADRVAQVDDELARVDSLLASLDAGHTDALEVIDQLTERVKKTAPTIH